jgi:hypothetical protein
VQGLYVEFRGRYGAFSSQCRQLPESYFWLLLCNLGTLFRALNVAGTVLAAALLIAVVIGEAPAPTLTAAVISAAVLTIQLVVVRLPLRPNSGRRVTTTVWQPLHPHRPGDRLVTVPGHHRRAAGSLTRLARIALPQRLS